MVTSAETSADSAGRLVVSSYGYESYVVICAPHRGSQMPLTVDRCLEIDTPSMSNVENVA